MTPDCRKNGINRARKCPYLAPIQRPISYQIAQPTECQNPPKITQRKDARIRVLVKVGFCHVFPDGAKKIPDHDFHVRESQGGRASDRHIHEVSNGEE